MTSLPVDIPTGDDCHRISKLCVLREKKSWNEISGYTLIRYTYASDQENSDELSMTPDGKVGG